MHLKRAPLCFHPYLPSDNCKLSQITDYDTKQSCFTVCIIKLGPTNLFGTSRERFKKNTLSCNIVFALLFILLVKFDCVEVSSNLALFYSNNVVLSRDLDHVTFESTFLHDRLYQENGRKVPLTNQSRVYIRHTY